MSERIAPGIRASLAAEIAAARGREVSFVAQVDRDGVVVGARVVARGTVDAVLALPGVAQRGEMVLHNHPSGRLEPSGADLNVAAVLSWTRLMGIGLTRHPHEERWLDACLSRPAARKLLGN